MTTRPTPPRRNEARPMAKRPTPDTTSTCPVTRGEVDLAAYAAVDRNWVALGIPAPARRALVDAGLFALGDLASVTERDLRALHGMGPKAIAMLAAPMAEAGLAFLPPPKRPG